MEGKDGEGRECGGGGESGLVEEGQLEGKSYREFALQM